MKLSFEAEQALVDAATAGSTGLLRIDNLHSATATPITELVM